MKTLFTFVMLAMLLTLSTTLTFGQSPEANPRCEDFGYNRSVKIEGNPFARTVDVFGFGTITTTLPDSKTVDFTTSGSFAFVRGVIVKGGPDATVKHYNPAVWFDNGIRPPATSNGNIPDISHIEFCYNIGTTAAPASVSGRVVDKFGRGISNARVSALELSTGNTQYAVTNSFGNFTIADLETGEAYMIGVTAKGYSFSPTTFSLMGDVTDLILRAK